MKIGAALGVAEQAVEVAVPAARGAKVAVYAIGGLIVAILLAFAFWWFFIHPGQLRQAAAQGKVDGKLGTAAATITTEAIPQINDATRQKVEVDVQVQKGQIDVRAAPDAGTNIRGVSDGVLRNLCVQRAYAADRACLALHEDPAVVGPAGRDGAGTSQPD
ncbi:hypothetical protein QH494_15905 [Sphingomonas sp. AR_OL41]|uniref:hypothetical protein n=1 Tax=Sphingomonas sp. AR_OL41 TaxID=3042729 RepID=UPI0024818977|nr:hypothetical protein [Sphingomonas sp. AR_OL41]MDH7973676.1 hypothetical protein [Sphingomonas sp. AR_OL41]